MSRSSYNNYSNISKLHTQQGFVVENLIRRLCLDELGFVQAEYSVEELKYLAKSVGGPRYHDVCYKYKPKNEHGWLDAMFKLDLILDLSTPQQKCRVGFDITSKRGIELKVKGIKVAKMYDAASSLLVEHHVVLSSTLPRHDGWGLYPKPEKERVLEQLEGLVYEALEVKAGTILYLEF